MKPAAGRAASASSLLLGVATGLLWAPCAGPDPGPDPDGRGDQGRQRLHHPVAAGLCAGRGDLAGGGAADRRARVRRHEEKPGRGRMDPARAWALLVLAGVVAIALGLDTGLLTQLSLTRTNGLEQSLLQGVGLGRKTKNIAVAGSNLPVEGTMPELNGAVEWLNSPPLTRAQLARQGGAGGFLDLFLHQLPALAALCRSLGAEIQGSRPGGDRRACAGIRLRESSRQCEARRARSGRHLSGGAWTTIWPSGRPSTINTGRRIISSTPRAASATTISAKANMTSPSASSSSCCARPATRMCPAASSIRKAQGVQAAATPEDAARSPETYVGYGRGSNFAAGPVHMDQSASYQTPFPLQPNQWGLTGRWTIGEEKSVLDARRRQDHLPLPCPRPASGAGAGRRRQAGALQGDAGRPGAGRKPWHGHRCRRQWHGDQPAALSADPAGQQRGHAATTPSPSNSWTPACRPSPLPSAEAMAWRTP